MKKLLLFMMCIPAIAAQSLSANAQHTPGTKRNTTDLLADVKPHSNFHNAAKTTTDSVMRLTAIARLTYDGSGYMVNDSAMFSYSANRGIVVIENSIVALFDNVTSLKNTGSAFVTDQKSDQTFDTHNNILSRSDQAWIPWLSNWRNSDRTMYTYDAADNQLTATFQNWDTTASAWVNSGKTISTYTATNKEASFLNLQWNMATSAWDSGHRSTNAYDASDFLMSTVHEGWNGATLTWDSGARYTYVNNASGKALDETGMSWNSATSSWENSSKSTRTYDASNRVLTDLFQMWNNTTSNWQNLANMIFSGYVGSMVGSQIHQTWDNTTSSFVNGGKLNFVYNTDTLPTLLYDESWDSTSGTWQRTADVNNGARYHYQKNAITTATPNTIGLSGTAAIYPVPAKDAISVNITWDEPQAFTITITDMLGRVISSSNVNECSSYSGSVPTNNLASGNYLIKLEGANGKLTQRFVVEK